PGRPRLPSPREALKQTRCRIPSLTWGCRPWRACPESGAVGCCCGQPWWSAPTSLASGLLFRHGCVIVRLRRGRRGDQVPGISQQPGAAGALAIILLPERPAEAPRGPCLRLAPLLFVSVGTVSGEVPWPNELC